MSEQPPPGAAPDALVELARAALDAYVREGRVIDAGLPGGEPRDRAGVFVSLHGPGGALRGCIGTFVPMRPTLAEEIVGNAIAAGSRDPRFAPLAAAELAGLHVTVDVLGEPEEVAGVADLDPKRYGLIVRTDDGRQALLLPDLEGIDTAEQQLLVTCRKGGISAQHDRYRLYRFEVRRHDERPSTGPPGSTLASRE